MDLGLSEEQEMLKTMSRDFLTAEYPKELIKEDKDVLEEAGLLDMDTFIARCDALMTSPVSSSALRARANSRKPFSKIASMPKRLCCRVVN